MSEEMRKEVISLGIGNKIRNLRKSRGMTLARLGELADLSVGFLSQVENDIVVPPLTTLMAISRALEVKLETFFFEDAPQERVSVVKQADQITVQRRRKDEVGYHYLALAHRRSDKNMEPFLVEFEPRKKEEMKYFEHPGQEYIYVIDGVIEFRSNDTVHVLEAGDSIYFDSDLPHAARGLEPGKSRAIIVVTT
ncbi:MAG: cupin domain-containing protein [Kiritimatiellaceae bacterium]|nr:cupin domain-containing protein [Kiritimatiellaceae bacterium]